ncbi:MAG: hypothetical protein ACMXYG_00105 [Candidatus Woesearchaeota archaeon]
MTNTIILEKIIKTIVGTAIPKPEDNQNTDDMVYGGQLNRISFKGYGKDLFANERIANPNHPLNDDRYKGATILIGGDNYGCGSSREHAPQAHLDYGFKALITAGYAGIFQANCASIGLVAVTLPKADIITLADLVKENPSTSLTIDINDKTISYESFNKPNAIFKFDIPENVRQSFLNGTWDALALLRSNPEQVAETMATIPYFSFK